VDWPAYLGAGSIGGVVGVAELASRYKFRPRLAVLTTPGILYVVVNVVAAAVTLLLIEQFRWTMGMNADDPAVPAARVLVAGFGAMALLRSSLFVVRVGDKDVGVGPGLFLSGVVDVVDAAVSREVDRGVVRMRGRLARLAMGSLSFERAAVELPAYCVALSSNIMSAGEQSTLSDQVTNLRHSNVSDEQKVVMIGLLCINAFGETLVETVIEQFGDTMAAPQPP
jgi:hypothetical protein